MRDIRNNGEKTRVILADSDEMEARRLADYLESNAQIEVVAVCGNGVEALNKTLELRPDCLLLDLILPVLDGLSVLEQLKAQSSATSVIVASALENSKLIHYACALGAEFYVCKPYDKEVVLHRMMQLTDNSFYQDTYVANVKSVAEFAPTKAEPVVSAGEINRGENLEYQVTNIIRMFGIPAHIKGYQYIREGILLSLQDEDMLSYITKFLYPTIAKEYHTTSSSVERAIRHAIGVAWERGNAKQILRQYGYYCGASKKPTNSEFLSLIVDRFRVERANGVFLYTAKAM